MTPNELDAIRARAEAARQAAASGTTGTPPNVDGLSIHDALDIFAESAEDMPALLAEVDLLRRGRDICRAERDRLAATVDRVRETVAAWGEEGLEFGPGTNYADAWADVRAAIEGTDS